MKLHIFALLSLLAGLQGARAHADHAGEPDSNVQYAAQHMTSEHHIDSFDLKAFFLLHDLNRDGFWDRDEIEAIYGVHHVYSQKQSADEKEHQAKADKIVETVLHNVDKNGDGKISAKELQDAGLDLLPNFKDMGAEGHHYDVESEFFLHHEEIYHSTPETQTDEAYNHPEDIEHFAIHDKIEAEEEDRERRYQGMSPDAPPSSDAPSAPASSPASQSSGTPSPSSPSSENPVPGVESLPPEPERLAHPHDDQKAFGIPQAPPSPPPIFRNRETSPDKLSPEVKYGKGAAAEGKDEWGRGPDGYKPPRSPADKMRRNVPYKYKFRRNWGDF